MNVSVWGLGCPGLSLAASLAQRDHTVVGIDIDENRIAAINAGQCDFKEPGLALLISESVRQQKLRAKIFQRHFAPNADVSFIVVGTPARADGRLDTSQIEAVANALQNSSRPHFVVLRSTVPVGFTRQILTPLLPEHTLAVSPEFLREGDALNDLLALPSSIVGVQDRIGADIAAEIFQTLGQTVVQTSFEEAEMLKLVTNAFHALKAGFANEVGRLCASAQIDAGRIMSLLCRDQHLNISPAYLRPGFAFGGACLSKDVAALAHQSRDTKISLPIIENILPSNSAHLDWCLNAIASTGHREIGILGLTSKPSSDGLRHSSSLHLIAMLRAAGYSVRAFDPDVRLNTLTDRNRRALENLLPDYQALICESLETVAQKSSLLIVTQARSEFETSREIFRDTPVLNFAHAKSPRDF